MPKVLLNLNQVDHIQAGVPIETKKEFKGQKMFDEINKIMNTTIVNDLDIDGKEKYGKIMKEYFTLQQKSVGIKMDIAKLMAEIVKNKGNVKEALESETLKNSKLDFAALRKLAKEASIPANESENYNIKN